jgi:hypothetical protein
MKRISSQPPVTEDWPDFSEESDSQYLSINIGSQTKHSPRSQVEVESPLALWFEVVAAAAAAASILKSANSHQTEFDQMVIITDLPQSLLMDKRKTNQSYNLNVSLKFQSF